MSEGREYFCSYCHKEVGMMGYGAGRECAEKLRGDPPRCNSCNRRLDENVKMDSQGRVIVSEEEAFARGAKDEREACARLVLNWVTKSGIMSVRSFKEEIAAEIRARGK